MISSLYPTKDADAKSAYFENAKISYTGDACATNICARGTYIKNVFFALSAYIKDTSLDNTSIKDADKKSAYAGALYAVKHLKIYLQIL